MFTNPSDTLSHIGVQSGMRVADFGSGSGAYVIEFAHEVGFDGKVYAIEIQKELLNTVVKEAERAGYRNIVPVWTDMEKVGFSKIQPKSLDIVLISNVLFQVDNKQVLFTEAEHVLNHSGRLVVIDWTDSFGGIGPKPDVLVDKEMVIDLAQQAGLSLKEEFNPGEHHYGVIFKRNSQ